MRKKQIKCEYLMSDIDTIVVVSRCPECDRVNVISFVEGSTGFESLLYCEHFESAFPFEGSYSVVYEESTR